MRILVVEDDAKLASMLARSLREEGYAVDEAGDGDGALYQAAVNDYDAIVLDVGLPRRDGMAVSRTLRERGSRTPILMLTARDTVDDRVAGLDAGADDYLVKPFAIRELLARLRALLRRLPELLPTTLEVDDLVLDTRDQTAARAGRPIALTTKEYTILEYLARNAGRIVGRAELSSHAWDENYDPVSNAIEVHMARLRKKVDEGHRTPLLHTRRGAGYLLGVTPPGSTTSARRR